MYKYMTMNKYSRTFITSSNNPKVYRSNIIVRDADMQSMREILNITSASYQKSLSFRIWGSGFAPSKLNRGFFTSVHKVTWHHF